MYNYFFHIFFRKNDYILFYLIFKKITSFLFKSDHLYILSEFYKNNNLNFFTYKLYIDFDYNT